MSGGRADCTGDLLIRSVDSSATCGQWTTPMFTHAAIMTQPSAQSSVSMSAESRHTATGTNSTPSFQDLVESLSDYKVSLAAWRYCPPFILAIGTFGNVMILWVLGMPSGTSSSSSSISIFFRALAVSDLTLLYTGLLRNWIKYFFHLDIRDQHSAICKIHIFLVYVTSMTSAWFLAMMTTQRALSVVWPNKLRQLRRQMVALLTVSVFLTLICLLNTHHLYGYDLRYNPDLGQYDCQYLNADYEYFTRVSWAWIDLCMSSLLPFAFLLTSNSLLMWKVTSSIRKVRTLTNSGSRSEEVVSQRQKQSTSLNVTLIFLSATFFLLTSPVCVFIVFDLYSNPEVETGNAEQMAANSLGWALTNLLWYSNSAVNFYLYCLTGARFRAQVRHCLCCVTPSPRTKFKSEDQTRSEDHQSLGSSSHM